MPYYAYVVRSKESGAVVYCGITTKKLSRRWNQHTRSEYALGRAIRKYGVEAFSMELIAESWSFDDLKEFERLLIKQYDTFGPGGYNLTEGGDGFLGAKHSEETRAKFSRDRAGKIWTEEEKAKLRAARAKVPHPMLGKRHSEEARAKIKQNRPDHNGEKNPFYGKNHTPETIKKISGQNNHAYGKRLTLDQRAKLSGENNPRFGMTHTAETKQKMSAKQRGSNNPNFGRPWSEERRAKHMATLAAKGFKVEVKNAVC